jgi:hypothetical protein
MQDVGGIVKYPPEPVTAEVADHRAALGFGIGLDGMADIAGMGAGLDRHNPALETFIGDFHEPLGLSAHFACPIHPARVSVPAIEDKRHVDIENITLAQRLVAWDAVADDVVEGSADRLGIPPVVQGCR